MSTLHEDAFAFEADERDAAGASEADRYDDTPTRAECDADEASEAAFERYFDYRDDDGRDDPWAEEAS